jgi:hypothetical protein
MLSPTDQRGTRRHAVADSQRSDNYADAYQNLSGPQAWWASSQATSTVLLPDGNPVTAFGTGFRSQSNAQGMSSQRDVVLVQWRLNEKSVVARVRFEILLPNPISATSSTRT